MAKAIWPLLLQERPLDFGKAKPDASGRVLDNIVVIQPQTSDT